MSGSDVRWSWIVAADPDWDVDGNHFGRGQVTYQIRHLCECVGFDEARGVEDYRDPTFAVGVNPDESAPHCYLSSVDILSSCQKPRCGAAEPCSKVSASSSWQSCERPKEQTRHLTGGVGRQEWAAPYLRRWHRTGGTEHKPFNLGDDRQRPRCRAV